MIANESINCICQITWSQEHSNLFLQPAGVGKDLSRIPYSGLSYPRLKDAIIGEL